MVASRIPSNAQSDPIVITQHGTRLRFINRTENFSDLITVETTEKNPYRNTVDIDSLTPESIDLVNSLTNTTPTPKPSTTEPISAPAVAVAVAVPTPVVVASAVPAPVTPIQTEFY